MATYARRTTLLGAEVNASRIRKNTNVWFIPKEKCRYTYIHVFSINKSKDDWEGLIKYWKDQQLCCTVCLL